MEIAVEHLYWPRMNRESVVVRLSFQLNQQIDLIEPFSKRLDRLLFLLWTDPRSFCEIK